jgi:aspartate/methionine/tyrosine aminotransferase
MSFRPFALERLFARWEFAAPHLLSSSDCESMTVGELLALAGWPAARLLDAGLGYTESPGAPELRAAIAARAGVAAADVVVCAPAEGILLAASALLAPGDRVVVETPGYQSLEELPRRLGCTVARWPLVETEAGWRMDLERLDELVVPGTRLLVVNAPHNPTGHQPSPAELGAILALAEARGARVLIDEMYRGLEPRPEQRLPPVAALDARAVSLGGLSKSFGLAGLRIGWLATRDREAVDAVIAHKDYTTICAPGPTQLLACAALEQADALEARARAIIAANLERARAFVARHAARFAWRAPDAGSVALARLAGGGAEAFCARAVAEAGVMIVPSTVFDFGDAHVRLGLGRTGFGPALAALEAWLGA